LKQLSKKTRRRNNRASLKLFKVKIFKVLIPHVAKVPNAVFPLDDCPPLWHDAAKPSHLSHIPKASHKIEGFLARPAF
jgi:hypothetical protein